MYVSVPAGFDVIVISSLSFFVLVCILGSVGGDSKLCYKVWGYAVDGGVVKEVVDD
jgi:hypothetical protein